MTGTLRRAGIPLALLAGMLAPPYADAQAADAARGRALYTQHCASCHAPGVHGRTSRTPATRDELRAIVDDFARRSKLGWTAPDVEDVVEHLRTMSYRFPPEK